MVRKKSLVVFILFSSVLYIAFSFSRCSNNSKNIAQPEGEGLAKKYCKSCHQYPSPLLLDSETWVKHILPAMAPRLGIKVYGDDQYINELSSKSAISYADWMKIVEYYSAVAPKALKPAQVNIEPLKDWAMFTMRKPKDSVSLATTTLVAFDTIGRHIFTSDEEGSSVYQWGDNLTLQATRKFKSGAVDVQFSKDGASHEHGDFTFIGSMMAVDVSNGNLRDIDLATFNKDAGIVVADSIARPVQSVSADFDKDGLTDKVVCGFGHNIGGLYLYKQLPGHKFQKKIIRDVPGAIHAITGDFNNDGWPDIMCLFAHADEGVWMFLNDHKGGFTSSNLLRFPPVYGSSSFQVADFNNDGKPDILYTSGDNSDYSKILKPFHGIYIFLNQGNFKFKQSWFYPVNGATKAMAADFNGDGKLDIALIAFFSDLKNNPAEGFTYFEQDKPMHFVPHNIPVYNEGRWICMDVNDYNGDGKPDIILGNYCFGFINQTGIKRTWNQHSPYIILENTGNKIVSK